jgi:hypothetical protein
MEMEEPAKCITCHPDKIQSARAGH